MVGARQSWSSGAAVRLAGIGLLACCYELMSWLFQRTGVRAGNDPTMLDYVGAVGGFLCLAGGAGLTVLGAHIFDRVEISARWARADATPSVGRRGDLAQDIENGSATA